MIVATAGHIDHGKTTLVKALTGVDTDRLPEEKKRGISIDIGFAYRKTATGDVIGFVDVPGHERFVRNMLAGVCGIDYVMLIVAADDGVMPQTVEHLHIVDLLTVRRGIAVITKTDRVPAERVTEVAASVRALLAPTALSGIEVLPVSAISGEGVEQLREALTNAAREHGSREHAGRNLRYAIDRVFTIAGSGTVVTGTVFNGAVAIGDKLMLSPSGIEVRVRGIQKDGKAAQQASAGERCALNVTGADVAQIHRGDWVVAPAIHAPTQRLDVRLQLLASEMQPLKHWTPVHLHLGTADVTARIAIRRGAAIAPGASAVVQIIADKPLAALNGDRFIIRDQSAMRTIGGGTVIDPFVTSVRRNAQTRAARLAALENTDPAAALAALLAASPAGVDLTQFERSFNLTSERAAQLANKPEIAIVGKELRVALPRATVDGIKLAAVEALTRFHRESPQATGLEISTLRKQLAPALPAATFTALLRELGDEKKIEVAGSSARLPRHVATDNPADEKMWQALKPLLDNAGFNVPPLRELAPAANLKEAILKDFLHRKARTSEVIRVTPERFYPRATLAQLAAVAQAVTQTVPGGQFTAAQYRDATGVGRGLAIEILECLDRLGITQRIGDARKMRKDFVPILGAATAPPPPAAKPPAATKPVPQTARRTPPHQFKR
ncbi:MAG: selenocysteine-specific translation elongation factor [Betaproteobacteria bacterium]|nr:selenocysteine-specific translation elongation factor [Betaproteobacteria bacterium]